MSVSLAYNRTLNIGNIFVTEKLLVCSRFELVLRNKSQGRVAVVVSCYGSNSNATRIKLSAGVEISQNAIGFSEIVDLSLPH